MRANNIRILCSVIKVDLVHEDEDGTLTQFFDAADSPLMCSEELRSHLKEKILAQNGPYLYQGEEH